MKTTTFAVWCAILLSVLSTDCSGETSGSPGAAGGQPDGAGREPAGGQSTGGSDGQTGGQTPVSTGGGSNVAPDAGTPGRPSGGCGAPWSAPADLMLEESRRNPPVLVARREMSVAGQTRQYLISVPVDYDATTSYSLVFGFHGQGGDREQLRRYMNIEAPSNGRAIVIYPSSLTLDDGRVGWALSNESNDLAFVDALLEKYTSEFCVDETRIFATGHSFGGCMSNTVGCFRGDVFRAIAPIAGCGPFSRAECVGQIATLQIHSPKDTSTQYSGAIRTCTRYLRANHCDEMPECGCHWVDELESPESQCVQEAQEPYDPGVPVEVTERDEQEPIFRSYVNCDDRYPVVFVDHWRRERAPDDTREERWHNPPPWSASVIWHFFDQLLPPNP